MCYMILDYDLKRERLRRGFTQQELADAVGCTQGSISLAERNQRPVSRVLALALARALDLDEKAPTSMNST